MTTYTQFAESMILALYQETEATNKQYLVVGELITKYGIEVRGRWLDRLVEEWRNDFVDFGGNGPDLRDWGASITAKGLRYVEGKYGSKDGVGVVIEPTSSTRSIIEATDAAADFSDTDTAVGILRDVAVDSSSWTGLPSDFVLTEAKQATLLTLLKRAESDLDALGVGKNSEKAMARAFIIAARTLADTPEPPADLIWQILQRTSDFAGIASLFVSIISLFSGAAH